MIFLSNVSKSFKTSEGTVNALKNISFSVEQGKCVVIGGENGSGKSVLMSIIAGLEKAQEGSVDCSGKVGLVFQEAETQILGETPIEDVAFGPKNLGFKKEEIERAVKIALEKTGLISKANYPSRFLSGGEKRRLAVACMIAMDLPIIIFDEPYANLDYSGVKQVNKIIRLLKNEKKTILILTHEIEKCLGFADNFLVLFKGEIVFNGEPSQALKENLEKWNIRNPIASYKEIKDLIWE
ncbi:MAG: ABC transporter ATP-binding protein [Treponemataceae bacterium]